jgi:hypothetical protein
VTAEGDRVAVEANGVARTNDGYVYRNRYHFLFRFQNGTLVAAVEYCDSQAVAALIAHVGPSLLAAHQ